MSCLISRAASALRPASDRTSPATTAKPLPCSPATPMRRELSLMQRMVSTICLTIWPPSAATCEAFCASWLACMALSTLLRTVAPSSSMDAAVCCSALAWLSARALRSWLPEAISELALATDSEPSRTC